MKQAMARRGWWRRHFGLSPREMAQVRLGALWLIASYPVLLVLWLLAGTGPFMWRGRLAWWTLGFFALLFSIAGRWAWHFLKGNPRLGLAFGVIAMGLALKLVFTNWVVEARYVYMGEIEKEPRCYYPDSSPLWLPPQRGRDDWNGEFPGGGWGGPIGEPRLRVYHGRVWCEFTLFTLVFYSALYPRKR